MCNLFNDILEDYLYITENNAEVITKFFEFIINLISQNSTRKFLLPLLKEKHFYERISINTKVPVRILEVLKFYVDFPINENSGRTLDSKEILNNYYEKINNIKTIAFKLFPDKLSKIYLNNISGIDNTENINLMLDILNSEERIIFADLLNLLKYKKEFYSDREQLVRQIFVSSFSRKASVLESINSLPLFPDEKFLFKSPEEDEYITPMSLQYLNYYDYLLRSFNLFREEAILEIKKDVLDTVERTHPLFDAKGNLTEYRGWARMGMAINSFKILNVRPATIGSKYPHSVTARIEVDFKGVQSGVKAEWDKLKKYDVLFLINLNEERDSEDLNRIKSEKLKQRDACFLIALVALTLRNICLRASNASVLEVLNCLTN
jgi:intron-binding protein aquarius